MVTASEGRPSPVTRKPLSAPATAPSRMQSGMIVWIDIPLFHIQPMSELVRPSVLATDRSISPVTMIIVIGSATRMIGIRSRTRNVKLRLVPKLSTANDATIRTTTVSRMMMLSQLARRLDMAPGLGMLISPPQRAGDAHRDQPVGADRQDDQEPDDGLLPELVDFEHREGAANHGQQQRAETGSPDRAAATEDGHPADHDRGHDVELVAGAGGRVDRAEPGREQHPGQAGE